MYGVSYTGLSHTWLSRNDSPDTFLLSSSRERGWKSPNPSCFALDLQRRHHPLRTIPATVCAISGLRRQHFPRFLSQRTVSCASSQVVDRAQSCNVVVFVMGHVCRAHRSFEMLRIGLGSEHYQTLPINIARRASCCLFSAVPQRQASQTQTRPCKTLTETRLACCNFR